MHTNCCRIFDALAAVDVEVAPDHRLALAISDEGDLGSWDEDASAADVVHARFYVDNVSSLCFGGDVLDGVTEVSVVAIALGRHNNVWCQLDAREICK